MDIVNSESCDTADNRNLAPLVPGSDTELELETFSDTINTGARPKGDATDGERPAKRGRIACQRCRQSKVRTCCCCATASLSLAYFEHLRKQHVQKLTLLHPSSVVRAPMKAISLADVVQNVLGHVSLMSNISASARERKSPSYILLRKPCY